MMVWKSATWITDRNSKPLWTVLQRADKTSVQCAMCSVRIMNESSNKSCLKHWSTIGWYWHGKSILNKELNSWLRSFESLKFNRNSIARTGETKKLCDRKDEPSISVIIHHASCCSFNFFLYSQLWKTTFSFLINTTSYMRNYQILLYTVCERAAVMKTSFCFERKIKLFSFHQFAHFNIIKSFFSLSSLPRYELTHISSRVMLSPVLTLKFDGLVNCDIHQLAFLLAFHYVTAAHNRTNWM